MKPRYPIMDSSVMSGAPGEGAVSMPAVLIPPYAALTPAELLAHFRRRAVNNYFPLQAGKTKHVVSAEPILTNEFTLNNETHRLGDGFAWMHNPSPDPEWLILLHKFYYVRDLALAYDYSGNERYAEKWVALVGSWIEQVPDGFVNSQVTGRRLQQWLLAYHYFVPGRHCPAVTAEFLLALLASIQSQALFLSENLTPAGNHRTIELYAIFAVAVLLPELGASASLLRFAQRELLENLRRDFLADGVQKELSTDYHHTVLKNFLRVRELAELNGLTLPAEFDSVMHKALQFSIHAHKPDGLLPAINDGDVNSYLALLRKAHAYYPSAELLYAASRSESGRPPLQRSRLFGDSGYAILRSDWAERPYSDGRYLFFDCGGLGFGSHGHYDLLSFEAAAFGRSLIVDPGRYTYHETHADGVNWRHAFKGTAAHNTVMVDGKDQITYQCHNPIGPEPSASVLNFVVAPDFDFVRGKALSPQYPVEHQRSIYFAESDYWIITDLLIGGGCHCYEQIFHLGAEALHKTRLLTGHGGVGIVSPNLLMVQAGIAALEIALEIGWVSPQYGVKQPAPVVRFSQTATDDACFQTVLYPYAETPPELCVVSLPVTDAGRILSARQALALSIVIQSGKAVYYDRLLLAHDCGGKELSFEEISCRAQLLFMRRDGDGNILSLQAHAIRFLKIGCNTLLNNADFDIQFSYAPGRLYLKTSRHDWRGALCSLDGLQQVVNGIAGITERVVT